MPNYDPEKFNLTKQQVLDIIDRRIKEWNKNKRANMEYILEGYAVKLLVKRANEEKFKHFWRMLISDIDAIRYENVRQELPPQFKESTNISSEYSLDLARMIKNA